MEAHTTLHTVLDIV